MNSIPYTAHSGLLYAPGLDWANWALYAIVGLAALFLMPGQLRESMGRLWAPAARFFAGLSALMEVLRAIVGFTCCMGLVRPFLCWDDWPEDEEPDDRYRGVGLAGTGPDP